MEKNKTTYANGQLIEETIGNIRTIYFKNGKIKAQGPVSAGKMDGKWTFYRETGELWQTGELKADIKHGIWERFDRDGQCDYHEEFREGRQVKKNRE